MRNRKAQGFTLIELLIVIAIIGILAAVLIPNLMSARTTAAQRAAQAHSQNVYTASVAALAENVLAAPADIGPATCMTASPVTVTLGGVAGNSNYSYNDAPAQTQTCTVGVGADGDIEVVVDWGTGTVAKEYTNGVDTTP